VAHPVCVIKTQMGVAISKQNIIFSKNKATCFSWKIRPDDG